MKCPLIAETEHGIGRFRQTCGAGLDYRGSGPDLVLWCPSCGRIVYTLDSKDVGILADLGIPGNV